MMKSQLHSYSSIPAVLVSLLFTLSFIALPCSSSIVTLQQSPPVSGLRIALQHIDSGKSLTKFERIRHALKREKQRRETLKAMLLAGTQISSQVHPTITGLEYVMQVGIGTPPVRYNAVINTGADLIWTQCKPCLNCMKQSTLLFDSEKSSSFSNLSCSSPFCDALQLSLCAIDICTYTYVYNKDTYTRGTMATETFTFGENAKVSDLAFGCGQDNHFFEEDGFGGVMGMGRGMMSLVSQLNVSKFSYCLPSIADDTKSISTLFLGSVPNFSLDSATTKTTYLVKNKIYPSFYYVMLCGISVGDARLDIDEDKFAVNDDGNGGMAIDASTTNTVLEEEAFHRVANEFASQMNATVDDTSSDGYVACFNLHSSVVVPKLVFHFENADIELDNYMINDPRSGKWCLTMAISGDGTSVLGNMQQRNMLVVYDLEKEMVSFVPKRC
ncbi:aspartic proteinase nepenthesin-1 [Daucus carota subsp. sativus]|nr:PREDICTED: aspartic proteinase nepenthesin-1-like [Daucus carota subsp. sativus]